MTTPNGERMSLRTYAGVVAPIFTTTILVAGSVAVMGVTRGVVFAVSVTLAQFIAGVVLSVVLRPET